MGGSDPDTQGCRVKMAKSLSYRFGDELLESPKFSHLKDDVVATCNALARRLGSKGLRFEVGEIAGYAGVDAADLVVSLHACDTATDAALERAVRWSAPVILAVPCCQHELSSQVRNAPLAPLLDRGLLRGRFASDVTDAARAQLLATETMKAVKDIVGLVRR